MKKKIISFMSRYFYPQNNFAGAILKFIDRKKGVKQLLIDAPCGNGETSWHFAKRPYLDVFAYDLDEQSIATAKANFKAPNLVFEAKSIFDVFPNLSQVDYFCIINSLFLLPDPEKILSSVREKMKDDSLLFVIVPNVQGKNYKWFIERNAGFNKLVLNSEEFASYFGKQGFEIKTTESLAYAHNFGRTDVRFLSVFAHVYLTVLNGMQKAMSIGTPNYYLIVLKRK
jgi:SAM-dependent methyltransferase